MFAYVPSGANMQCQMKHSFTHKYLETLIKLPSLQISILMDKLFISMYKYILTNILICYCPYMVSKHMHMFTYSHVSQF